MAKKEGSEENNRGIRGGNNRFTPQRGGLGEKGEGHRQQCLLAHSMGSQEKVGAGHANWEKFLQVVRKVDMDHIRNGVHTQKKEQEAWEKEQEEQETLKKRVQQLEKLTVSPTALLRQQMTTFSVGNPPSNPAQPPRQVPVNPFIGTAGSQDNLFQTAQTRSPAQNSTPRLPPTQADRAALLTRIQKYPHHPDMEAGRQAHQAQQADWAKTHGLKAMVTESTPYPLRPGTLPVGSGECFTCRLCWKFSQLEQ